MSSNLFVVLLFTQLLLFSLAARPHHRAPQCQPLKTSFSDASSVAANLSASFVAVSPEESYQVGKNGLELLLKGPDGNVISEGGVNDELGTGATVNSTFFLLYGVVTFEIAAPPVPGIVTAAILLSNATDEIDIEILGADVTHWQTNMFAPPSGTNNSTPAQPMYNVFSSVEGIGANHTDITKTHSYFINWTSTQIDWGVDGQVVRTLKKVDTEKNGVFYFPSHPARIQIGIWDASSPLGTCQWAKGPVNWAQAPGIMNATVKSVTVECP